MLKSGTCLCKFCRRRRSIGQDYNYCRRRSKGRPECGKRTSFGCNRCRKTPITPRDIRDSVTGEKVEPTIPNQTKGISQRVHAFHQKDPKCEAISTVSILITKGPHAHTGEQSPSFSRQHTLTAQHDVGACHSAARPLQRSKERNGHKWTVRAALAAARAGGVRTSRLLNPRKNKVTVRNIGGFDDEIDMTGLTGLEGMKRRLAGPSRQRLLIREGSMSRSSQVQLLASPLDDYRHRTTMHSKHHLVLNPKCEACWLTKTTRATCKN